MQNPGDHAIEPRATQRLTKRGGRRGSNAWKDEGLIDAAPSYSMGVWLCNSLHRQLVTLVELLGFHFIGAASLSM
jgi:hypothetical protein